MFETSSAGAKARPPGVLRLVPPISTSHGFPAEEEISGADLPIWIPASLTGAAAEYLVRQLKNLHDGPLVFHKVVQLGEVAIPALERLVRGPSQSVYQSRSLAVDALAAIGTSDAVQALTRALHDSVAREPDPASLEAESVLVNHIAEHLSRFSNPDVNDALLAALRRRPYPYCALALGLIGDARAVPLLVQCLFEDTARPAAAAALRQFGRAALPHLIQALREPRLVAGTEPPTRVDGRAAAAKLVGECAGADPLVDATALPALRKALNDRQRSVRVGAALALARSGPTLGAEAAGILVMALDELDWARANVITEGLVHVGPAAEPLIIGILGARPRNEEDRRRRLRAVVTAGRLGTPAAVARLRILAESPDLKLRVAAIVALSNIPALEVGYLTRYLADPEPAIRRNVLQALRRRRVLSLDSATRLLGDPDGEVRRLATASVRENLHAALPALHRAAYAFGAPLNGWASRWRLWWHACALLAATPGLKRTPH